MRSKQGATRICRACLVFFADVPECMRSYLRGVFVVFCLFLVPNSGRQGSRTTLAYDEHNLSSTLSQEGEMEDRGTCLSTITVAMISTRVAGTRRVPLYGLTYIASSADVTEFSPSEKTRQYNPNPVGLNLPRAGPSENVWTTLPLRCPRDGGILPLHTRTASLHGKFRSPPKQRPIND